MAAPKAYSLPSLATSLRVGTTGFSVRRTGSSEEAASSTNLRPRGEEAEESEPLRRWPASSRANQGRDSGSRAWEGGRRRALCAAGRGAEARQALIAMALEVLGLDPRERGIVQEDPTDGGRNPSFDDKFHIPLIEGLRELNVIVWNSNTLSSDDFIGSCRVQLHKVLTRGYDDSSWPLQTRHMKSAGEVKLIMHFDVSAMKYKMGKSVATSSTYSSGTYSVPPVPAPSPAVASAMPYTASSSPYPPPSYPAAPPYQAYPAPPAYPSPPPQQPFPQHACPPTTHPPQPYGQPYPTPPYGQPYPTPPYGQPYPPQPYGQPYPAPTAAQSPYPPAPYPGAYPPPPY